MLVCLHSSLICLLRTACFARALRYAHLFARLLTPEIMGKRTLSMTCTHRFHSVSTYYRMTVLRRKLQYHRDSDHITKTATISRTQRSNSILTAVQKPSEQVSMKLLYNFSVPILTYASEVKRFPCSEMHACQVALNDAIRRVFSYNRWESIRTLRSNFGYHDLYTLFEVRRRTFAAKIPVMGNAVVTSLRNFVTVTL